MVHPAYQTIAKRLNESARRVAEIRFTIVAARGTIIETDIQDGYLSFGLRGQISVDEKWLRKDNCWDVGGIHDNLSLHQPCGRFRSPQAKFRLSYSKANEAILVRCFVFA